VGDGRVERSTQKILSATIKIVGKILACTYIYVGRKITGWTSFRILSVVPSKKEISFLRKIGKSFNPIFKCRITNIYISAILIPIFVRRYEISCPTTFGVDVACNLHVNLIVYSPIITSIQQEKTILTTFSGCWN